MPRRTAISRAEFQDRYLRPRRAVVLTDLAADWPATGKWTPQYLADTFGDHRVRVYDASFCSPGRNYMSSIATMPFREFLDTILTTERDLRMFLHNIAAKMPALLQDIRFPTLADRFSSRFVFTFFGCRGAVTPIHYDIDLGHVFHTALYGRRRIYLFPKEQSAHLYRHPFTVRSYVDAERPDFARFPALARAHGQVVTVQPGETLFMPSGYWHQVVYEEAGYGISLRCPSERLMTQLAGYVNLALISPIDRLMNKLAAERWFTWKARAAKRRAERP
ncbi:MAG: cupin-like domain-containing protein [Candidatus Binatia bacterium]